MFEAHFPVYLGVRPKTQKNRSLAGHSRSLVSSAEFSSSALRAHRSDVSDDPDIRQHHVSAG
jgi:hypothetical protein